ncbi:Uncharacterized protein SVXHr_0624 [Halorhabdus sp. SVX81]|nr:Uncharacterized protein SVXHr_0624 [Halorhabdus sp. SVX81]
MTAEPDPEMIVIDLRGTHTVGPIITLLDTLVSIVAPWFRTSRLKQASKFAGGQETITTNSRTLQVLRTVLEPPAPPEGDGNSDFRN